MIRVGPGAVIWKIKLGWGGDAWLFFKIADSDRGYGVSLARLGEAGFDARRQGFRQKSLIKAGLEWWTELWMLVALGGSVKSRSVRYINYLLIGH